VFHFKVSSSFASPEHVRFTLHDIPFCCLNKANHQSFVADQSTLKDTITQGSHLEHSFPLFFRIGNSFLRSLSIYHKRYLDDTHHIPSPTPSPHFITASQLAMMDRIGSAPSVDMMGKLSVRVLDSVRPPCSCPNSELIIAPTSIPDNPIPSMSSPDQFPVCPNFTSSLPFLYCSLSFLFFPLRSSRPRPLII
jgi:hypothetical protein